MPRWIGCAGLLLVLLAGCTGEGTPSDSTAPGAGAPEKSPELQGRVVLIGLDGADWRIIDRLEQQGRLPNLARLRREGSWGVLHSEKPLLSPIVWTTIATGRPALDHGILGFLTVRNGKTEPVRSDERRVPAFWNLAERMGFSVGVVGWYASWPAERVNGFLLSDRIGYHQVQGQTDRARTGLVYPEALFDEVDSVRHQIEERLSPQAAARFFSAGGKEGGARVGIDQERLDTFVGVLRTTELYRTLTPRLMKQFDPDLTAVYFEGTDSVGHLFAEYAPPPLPGIDPQDVEHLGVAFDRFYEYIDTVVGELVAELDPQRTTLLIVSDHGFKSGEARPRAPTRGAHGDQAPLWHRPEGILLLWGRGVRAGVELPESSIFDVLPTAFRALGLPISLSAPGRPVEAAFTEEILSLPVESVEDYGPVDARDDAADLELPSDEVLAKLKALGYIGSTPSSASKAASNLDGPSPAEGQAALPLNRFNLGVVLLNDGKTAEALDIFRSLQVEVPQFPLGFLGEGLVLLQRGRHQEALGKLERAVASGDEFPAVHAALGEAYLGVGRTADAVRALRHALELDAADGRTALLLARIAMQNQDFERASTLFETARSYADAPLDRAGACVGLAVLAEERQRLDEAAERYEQALRLLPDHPRALERYGNLELFRGRPDHAVELLARLAAGSGDDAGVLTLYGRALLMAGRHEEAREVLQRALKQEGAPPEAREMLRSLEERPS